MPSAPLMGQSPVLGQTPAPWAQTGGPGQLAQTAAGVPPKRSAAPVVISLVMLAVLGVGGGVAFKVLGKSAGPESAHAALGTTASPVPATPGIEPPKSEAAKPEAIAKPSEPSGAASEPAAVPSGAPSTGAAGVPAKRLVPIIPPGGKRPPVGSPAVAAAPPPAAAPPALAPPTPAPAPTGRKIRTEL
jgi:hypothetical protein